ncbi:MAG: glycoside hydrolase family 3 C-terminal domain-containing protein, partial [Salinivirgaceae bacterium]|nr:glycoside hydrolase family 3 C-terminal domain-containing protein [Salinivirgaceae bacterium]
TLKHFVGHGIPEGGRNVAPVNLSKYDLMNEHLMPFAKGVEAGVLSIMPSYNEMNGVPNHASKWLLHDILHDELGFSGLITSDQNALDEMHRTQLFAPSFADAAKLAIENGVDVDLRYTYGTYDELVSLVKNGKLDEKQINQSVKKLLTLKYQLGLFDNKPLDTNRMLQLTNCDAHKKLALEASEKSLVLLKNQNNLLPLNEQKIKTLAVVGPLAKGVNYGGYTAEPRYDGVDVLEGIQNIAEGKFNVLYAEGCKIAKEESSFWGNEIHAPNDLEADQELIADAVKTAKQSDAIVLALGETVSFCREAWGENHLGDRESLELLGRQNQLVEELLKTDKPIVVLMFGGRPLSFNLVAEKVPSIVQVFYPGQEGGTAIASILFGKVNPSGKLAITIPKSVGQLPCYYSRKPSRMRSYIYFAGSEPLFAFGHGLSYTTYSYGELAISKNQMTANDTITVSIPVTNSGNRAGEEVVQLYIHDKFSSGIRPIKELKDFARVALAAGETKTVLFQITKEKLEYYNPDLQKVVEPGEFEVFVGTSSVSLQSKLFTVN